MTSEFTGQVGVCGGGVQEVVAHDLEAEEPESVQTEGEKSTG